MLTLEKLGCTVDSMTFYGIGSVQNGAPWVRGRGNVNDHYSNNIQSIGTYDPSKYWSQWDSHNDVTYMQIICIIRSSEVKGHQNFGFLQILGRVH